MTNEELSSQVAALLSKGTTTIMVWPTGRIGLPANTWLHESTEACAEILVTVLKDYNWQRLSGLIDNEITKGTEPRMAFRLCVLRGALELIKEK